PSPGPVSWVSWRDDDQVFHVIRVMKLVPARGGMVLGDERMHEPETARFQETLRRLSIIDEGFVENEAGLRFGFVNAPALDPKTAALLQAGVAVAVGSSAV